MLIPELLPVSIRELCTVEWPSGFRSAEQAETLGPGKFTLLELIGSPKATMPIPCVETA
jgi:hypothetical protein